MRAAKRRLGARSRNGPPASSSFPSNNDQATMRAATPPGTSTSLGTVPPCAAAAPYAHPSPAAQPAPVPGHLTHAAAPRFARSARSPTLAKAPRSGGGVDAVEG